MRTLFILALLTASSLPALAADIGDTVDTLKFKDTWYLPRELKDLGDAKAYVFVFVREGCPDVDNAVEAVRTLEADYGAKGAAFVAVDSCDADNEMQAAWFALRNQWYFPVVKDWDGTCAKALGVSHTPEIAVLDAQHVLRYRGRVDDPGHRYVAEALNAVLKGDTPAAPQIEAGGCALSFDPLPAPAEAITYAKDIAPIMAASCVACHQPNGQAPFDLSSYDAVAAHANMVAEVIREGRMPPWYAHPDYGKFLNDRHVSPDQITRVRQWVAGGKAIGDQTKIPLAPPSGKVETRSDANADGWQIEPDLIVEQKGQSAVPATGFVPYQYVFLPHVFDEDCYVQAIEIKPDHPKVLHHGNLFFTRGNFNVDENTDFLTGTVPGGIPSVCQEGIAWKIPKGANLCLQLHLVTTGKMETCKLRVGLRFARGKVDKLLYYHNFDEPQLEIAAGDPAHQVVKDFQTDEEVSAIGMFSHMHLRGKAMTFAAHYPDGKREWLMAVPNYSFDWQITYAIPPYRDHYPAGTTIECAAYYDNSRWNPYNPAPDAIVKQGPQTVDEMMNGFFVFTKDAEHLALAIDPKTGFAARQVTALK